MTGLLFSLYLGFIIGLAVAFGIFIILSLWGEKIVLIFAKARYITDDEILINQIKNFCCQCELVEVKVYWSNIFINNVYYVNSYFGKPTLIIGKNIYNTLTRKELNSLIYASFLKLKSPDATHRTITGLIFLIFYSPIFILRAMLKKKSISTFLDIFLYPAYYLKAKIFENEKSVLLFDQEVGKFDGLRKDYISALFKINGLPVCEAGSVGGLILNELNHIRNQTDDVFTHLFIDQISLETRVKALK